MRGLYFVTVVFAATLLVLQFIIFQAKFWVNKTLDNCYKHIHNKSQVLIERQKLLQNFYKISFVRDPLSRLFSAYRDKYTGENLNAWFALYTGIRARIICFSLSTFVKSDTDLEQELIDFIISEVNKNCLENHKVSIGMLISFILFIPTHYDNKEFQEAFSIEYPDYKLGSEFKETIINTHYTTMLSMCGHCSLKYNYIGTIETMNEDAEILKKKFDIKHDFPKVASTSKGAESSSDVRNEYDKLPELLKNYTLEYYSNDAALFGYDGYEVDSRSLNLKLIDRKSSQNCNKLFYKA